MNENLAVLIIICIGLFGALVTYKLIHIYDPMKPGTTWVNCDNLENPFEDPSCDTIYILDVKEGYALYNIKASNGRTYRNLSEKTHVLIDVYELGGISN